MSAHSLQQRTTTMARLLRFACLALVALLLVARPSAAALARRDDLMTHGQAARRASAHLRADSAAVPEHLASFARGEERAACAGPVRPQATRVSCVVSRQGQHTGHQPAALLGRWPTRTGARALLARNLKDAAEEATKEASVKQAAEAASKVPSPPPSPPPPPPTDAAEAAAKAAVAAETASKQAAEAAAKVPSPPPRPPSPPPPPPDAAALAAKAAEQAAKIAAERAYKSGRR